MRPRQSRQGALWKRRIIAVDGEGWDVDAYDRQCYKLLVAADDQGFESHLYCGDDAERLRTEDMLRWLYELPEGFLTGFSFGYDISMILLDLPFERLTLLRNRDDRPELITHPGKNENYIHYRGWWIDWIPGKRFTIRKNYKSRVIWDAFPWYQTSFVNAVGRSDIAAQEELDLVIAGKKRRGDDEHDVETELKYALMECRLLSRMQRKLFQTHEDAGLILTVFDGPGSTAAKALNAHNVRSHMAELPAEVESAARKSYVGGRFEETFHGRFDRLYEYDIVSAYPSACRTLPCLAHGEWVHEYVPSTRACLIHVRWEIDPKRTGLWGPFAVRKDDMPVWSYSGHAWVWEDEFDAAQWMGADSFTVIEAWSFVSTCDHQPFAFVDDYFTRRAELKAAGDIREKVYKLILNSVYGKLCQRVGSRPFHSWVWASMITAHCRAQLLKAMARDPWAVVMVTTDALYSQRELELPIGKSLGMWERGEINDVLLVQPGFFISQEKSRARGIPDRLVDWDAFDAVWNAVPELVERREFDVSQWGVALELPRFIGIKQGVHSGDPLRLGRWTMEEARFAFWSRKRPWQSWTGTHLVSYPPDTPTAGFKLSAYDPDVWSGERETEFTVENPDADEWSYTD